MSPYWRVRYVKFYIYARELDVYVTVIWGPRGSCYVLFWLSHVSAVRPVQCHVRVLQLRCPGVSRF
jgi:hypothetical protein